MSILVRILVILLAMAFTGCSYKVVYNAPSADNECYFNEKDLSIETLSADSLDISNIELKKYNESGNEYDILLHTSRGGSGYGRLDRWFQNEEGKWMHVQILNNIRNEEEVTYNDDTIKLLFNDFEAKSCLKFCRYCFECQYYSLLIKKDTSLFKYFSENGLFDLSENDNRKIRKYRDILNFFMIR